MCAGNDSCGCSAGIPLMVNAGDYPNPHVQYGQDDMVPYPVTIRTHLGYQGAQLRNGVGDINYPSRLNGKAARFNFGQIPRSPGLDRQSGSASGDFIPRGNAPSQWNYHVAMGPGMQPSNPGGPGQTMMSTFRNPGSGA
jgi:hypothetical protein